MLWSSLAGPAEWERLILPDGCIDVIWDGHRVFVAGPDTRARWHPIGPGGVHVGLRLSGGLGSRLLEVPAYDLLDRTPDVGDILPPPEARRLVEAVVLDPAGALDAWASLRLGATEPEPLGPRVRRMAAAGVAVADMAARLGLSPRQLQRRCVALFGYGPRHLTRVLRMERALEAARGGTPLAGAAAECGYADQSHLSRDIRDLTGLSPVAVLGVLGGR